MTSCSTPSSGPSRPGSCARREPSTTSSSRPTGAIGQDFVKRQQEQGWGTRVVERLPVDLRTAHPDVRGLSVRNLRYMAALATRWPTGIVQQRAAQLPWGHVMVILDSCPDRESSEFYAQRAVAEGWTRPVLQSMIASRLSGDTQDCSLSINDARLLLLTVESARS